MGIISIGSSSSYDRSVKDFYNDIRQAAAPTAVDPFENSNGRDSQNPDPKKFEIKKYVEVNGYLIVFINYEDCKNFEGNKILVYRNVEYKELIKQEIIDPHFSENKNFYSPMCRLEPTDSGWKAAQVLCLNLPHGKDYNQEIDKVLSQSYENYLVQ
jgi:hypothetical protein